MDNSKSPTLLTKEEAAIKLRIAVATLNVWIAKRKISYVKAGARVLFSEQDIENVQIKMQAL